MGSPFPYPSTARAGNPATEFHQRCLELNRSVNSRKSHPHSNPIHSIAASSSSSETVAKLVAESLIA